MSAIRMIALAALLAVAAAHREPVAGNATEPDAAAPGTKYPLKVGLYPWIPQPSAGDPTFSVMAAWIEATFEAANPDVDLILQPIQDPNFDFYDLSQLLTWLTSPLSSNDAWAIVEIDYSFFGSLLNANALAPFSGPDSQWNLDNMFPVGRKFYNVKKGYSVPHWLCSEFVMSRSNAIQNAPTAGALANALKNAVDQNAPAGAPNTVPVVYDMYSDWATPTFYLLGIQETFGRQAVENAIATPLPPVSNAVAQGSTKRIVQACAPRGSDPNNLDVNPCWNGDYYNSDPRALADLLASGQAVAAMGYSETMHDVIQSAQLVRKNELRIRTVPNGLFPNPDAPLAFSDGFVLNKFCTTNACQSAAKKFVRFMNSDQVFRYIMTAQDTQAPYRRVNRYLSAGMQSPYKFVKDDPVYTAVGKAYEDPEVATWPFSKNLIDNRLALYAAVRANVDPSQRVKFPDPHSRKFFARP